jgi:methionine synthase II (cobalamin-independent)
LLLAPDCGTWFMSRGVAFAKIRSLVTAANIVRGELP